MAAVGVDTRDFVSLAGHYVGVWTHFADGRTVPCLKDVAGQCGSCGTWARRWGGYLPVLVPGREGTHFVHLTSWCVRHCPEFCEESNDLFGIRFTLGRAPRVRRGKLVAQVSGRMELRNDRRIDRSKILAQLLGMWGVTFTVQESTQ